MFNPFKKPAMVPDQPVSGQKDNEDKEDTNFEEYARNRLKRMGHEISEEAFARFREGLSNPRSFLDSTPMETRLETDELIRQEKFKKGIGGEWEVIFNTYLLPSIIQEESRLKKAAEESAPTEEKKDSHETTREIHTLNGNVASLPDPSTETSLEQAQAYYKEALKLGRNYPEQTERLEESKNKLKKYLSKFLRGKADIEKITDVNEIKRRVIEICETIEGGPTNFDGSDLALLRVSEKKLTALGGKDEEIRKRMDKAWGLAYPN